VVFKKPVKNRSGLEPQKNWFYFFCGFYVALKKPVKNRSGLETTKKVVYFFLWFLGRGSSYMTQRFYMYLMTQAFFSPLSGFMQVGRGA
jgi:hypothetical protein